MSKNNIITVSVVLGLCLAMIFGISTWLGKDSSATKQADSKTKTETTEKLPAPLSAEQLAAYQVNMTNDKNPIATITTNLGVFELELFADTMPVTAGNFVSLAESGFYDGVKFHRVIEGFMIQSGDPISKTEDYLLYGTGDSGKTIPDEHVEGKYLTSVRGTIAMANSGPESGSSQFFINVVDNTGLDFDKVDYPGGPNNSKHPVFGRVLSGMEVVDKISEVPVNKPKNIPLSPVVVESVVIRHN
jgi:cyclophilin family peptidyl-prolyl cis-trans isomerase